MLENRFFPIAFSISNRGNTRKMKNNRYNYIQKIYANPKVDNIVTFIKIHITPQTFKSFMILFCGVLFLIFAPIFKFLYIVGAFFYGIVFYLFTKKNFNEL